MSSQSDRVSLSKNSKVFQLLQKQYNLHYCYGNDSIILSARNPKECNEVVALLRELEYDVIQHDSDAILPRYSKKYHRKRLLWIF